MNPSGTQPPELYGGPLTFAPCLCGSKYMSSYKLSWTLSQAGAWDEVKKPRWDMAFLMIVPSTNAGGDKVFGLAVVWAHPQQGHTSTNVEAAHKMMLLVDNGPDWLYAFVHMRHTVLHTPCLITDTLVLWQMVYTV